MNMSVHQYYSSTVCALRQQAKSYMHAAFSWVMAFVIALSIFNSNVVLSQEAAPDVAKPSDIRMVIDISGSMKKNDPQNLRRPALDMLVKLLPEGSKAGVWTFGQYVNMLVPHRPVDKQWSIRASDASKEIKSIAQFTNIGEALEKAAYDQQSPSTDFQKHIILLTDGMVDIDRKPEVNRQERRRILDTLLPQYQQAGFTIHTIALSDNADKLLLTRLALATDGKAATAKSADELMNTFLQVFNQAVPAEELPFDGNSFVTDSSIEEFTALIFRQPNTPPTEIIAPDRTRYTKDSQDDRVSWYHTDKYDLITVKQPLEGEWGVLAEIEPQSRITVVSDLSLAIKSLPTNISVNNVLSTSLALREENAVITRPEFLELLTIDVNIINEDNGQRWSQRLSSSFVPSNGIYSAELNQFTENGQYAITFTVDGKTFQRQSTHHVSVRQPFSVTVDQKEVSGNKQFSVQITSQSQDTDTAQTKVQGKLTTPSGNSDVLAFTMNEEGQWTLPIQAQERGQYTLAIRIAAVTETGRRFEVNPEVLVLNNQADDSVFSPPPVEVPKLEETPIKDVPVEEPPVLQSTDTKESVAEEVVDETLEEEADYSQLILYSGLGLINLLIIAVVYFIYRKLFKKKEELAEDSDDADPAISSVPGFTEPPMDEMMVDDLDDDPSSENASADDTEVDDVTLDDDMADTEDNTDGIDLDNDVQDDALAEMLNEDAEEEEVPDFSLDDFSPDDLDGDASEEKKP